MDESTKELWGAWIRFPQIEGDIEFNYFSMKIVKQYPLVTELLHPYFISSAYSTRFFEKSMLDKEYSITNELTVFYSTRKEKCIE